MALTLVQAVYPAEIGGTIKLKFDRPIDISGLDGQQIIVKDGLLLSSENEASGPAELVDPQTVQLLLVYLTDYVEPNRLLTASANSGIVAVDDGGTWAGVTDLALPWP